MSLFDTLPFEIQDIIMQYKYVLETNCLQAFVDDFEMQVLSSKVVKVTEYRYDTITRYTHKIRLTYKPTGKSVITSYGHGVSLGDKVIPKKSHVVHGNAFDAYWFKEGDWTYKRNSQNDWDRTYTYKDYVDDCIKQHGHATKLMSYQRFVRWRNMVRKTELMMQDRFERFIACSEEEPT